MKPGFFRASFILDYHVAQTIARVPKAAVARAATVKTVTIFLSPLIIAFTILVYPKSEIVA